MAQYKDLTGQRFGKLVVVSMAGKTKYWDRKWLCKCDCGGDALVLGGNLKRGHTTSCGCSRIDAITSHGGCGSRLYTIWSLMIRRCEKEYDGRYHRYGGRGISVCDEWRNSFEVFRDWAMENGYEPTLTIDRINNDGNYEPANCRWATLKDQAQNRGNSHV
jgi:hypothetical protein